MQDVRANLDRLIRARGDDYLSISRMLGRNAAYIQQFIKRGIPRKLDEDDRKALASYFGVDEIELGAADAAIPVSPVTMVPRLLLGASAGPGAVTGDEAKTRAVGFDRVWLKSVSANPAGLSMIKVVGDSMEPTLTDGDDIMVDASDAAERLREGIYVIRLDDALMVKRLVPAGKQVVHVRSDNKAHANIDNVDPSRMAVVGRVTWVGRRVR
jgi:Peptidase S24-like